MNGSNNGAIPIKEEVVKCLVVFGRKHPEISRLELFGSVARGDASPTSDVDVAVNFAPGWMEEVDAFDYFDHFNELEHELTAVFRRPVHLTDCAGVESNARIGNVALARAIARDGQLIYEADHPAKGCTGTHR